ncbi:MAG: DegT/DnrJ/EryC1/StrS family aminotransferase, partial [Planctomycetota bacterium]
MAIIKNIIYMKGRTNMSLTGGPGAYAFGDEERKELLDVMSGGYLYRYGSEDDCNFKQKVITFEKEFAQYIGTKYAVAVTNGSNALINAMATLGIGPGDEVIVPGYTFAATIGMTIWARAIPVLMEIDESLTMDPEDIEGKITEKTKAIIPVHMLGNPCDMDRIMAIAKKHNLLVIEDCCQSVGGSYKGKQVGNYGDMAAYSLNHYKTITSGDGGVVVMNDPELYETSFGVMDHGHKPLRTGAEIGFRSLIGYNMRMNELQGAVALAQLRKLDNVIATLRAKKTKLKNLIKDIPGIGFRKINDEGECSTVLTLLFPDKEKADKFGTAIGTKTVAHSGWHVYNNMENILDRITYTEINCPFTCPYYGREVKYHKHMLPQTDSIVERAINISIGVVDAGLGAGFGINLNSTDEEIAAV